MWGWKYSFGEVDGCRALDEGACPVDSDLKGEDGFGDRDDWERGVGR